MAGPVPPRTVMTAVLRDRRRIAWAEYGDPSGAPLLLLHGTPGSRLQARFLHGPARAAGIRVVAPDRPGYGWSDPPPGGATSTGYADDLRQLLDHLHLRTVTLGGLSGAGGWAVAAAILLPDRVRRLVLISGAVPAPRETLRGQLWPLRAVRWLAGRAPHIVGRVLAAQVSADPDSPTGRRLRRRLPLDDRRVLADPGWRAYLADDGREALRQGPEAAVRDLRLPRLAVDLADLTVETVLVHGSDDRNAPVGIARWLATQIPAGRLIEIPGAGHLFLLERPEAVLDLVVSADR